MVVVLGMAENICVYYLDAMKYLSVLRSKWNNIEPLKILSMK